MRPCQGPSQATIEPAQLNAFRRGGYAAAPKQKDTLPNIGGHRGSCADAHLPQAGHGNSPCGCEVGSKQARACSHSGLNNTPAATHAIRAGIALSHVEGTAHKAVKSGCRSSISKERSAAPWHGRARKGHVPASDRATAASQPQLLQRQKNPPALRD